MRTKVTRMTTIKMSNNAFRETMEEINSLLNAYNEKLNLSTLKSTFEETLSNYTQALDQMMGVEKETAALQTADKELISWWQRQKTYLNGLKTWFYDSETAEAAETIFNIMNQENNLARISFEDRYGCLEKMINRIDELDKTVLEKANCKKWFNTIKLKHKEVKELQEQRNKIKANIKFGIRRQSRIELELVYTFVIQFINFKLNYSYSEDYQALASQLDIIAKDVNAKIAAKNSREVEN